MTTTSATDQVAGDARLWSHLRVWLRYPSPRLLVGILVVAVAGRLLLGNLSWPEILVPVVILALQPFTEWLIHVHVLHFRPRSWRGRTIDLHLAKEHRRHHRDPRDLPLIFIPMPDLVGIVLVVGVLLPVVTRSWEWTFTIAASAAAMATFYEWIHYLVHTNHRPRTRPYRYMWRAHRLHHYKNEKYWMGVTMHAADHLLGTFPDKSQVETSPTARELLGRTG